MKHKKHRFTESSKWTRNSWFRKLSNVHKLFWIYINDMCDEVGVWEVDLELASFYLKSELDIEELLLVFKDQVHTFCDGRRWWIKDFVAFQYKELIEYSAEELKTKPSLKKSPRPKYVEMLKEHGLWDLYKSGNMRHKSATSEADMREEEEEKKEDEEIEEDKQESKDVNNEKESDEKQNIPEVSVTMPMIKDVLNSSKRNDQY